LPNGAKNLEKPESATGKYSERGQPTLKANIPLLNAKTQNVFKKKLGPPPLVKHKPTFVMNSRAGEARKASMSSEDLVEEAVWRERIWVARTRVLPSSLVLRWARRQLSRLWMLERETRRLLQEMLCLC
jgi:hypothetical protein